MRSTIEQRIAISFGAQRLAIGRVQNAGKLLTVCTGEARAFSGSESSYKVVALMQATMIRVPVDSPDRSGSRV